MKFVMYGDMHLRSTVPEARLDDYLANQDAVLKWLRETFSDHIHLCSGDVFHLARERSEPLTFAYEMARKLPEMHGVWGNHDLLYHSPEMKHKTTLGIMELINKFHSLPSGEPLVFAEDDAFGPVRVYGFHYGEEITHNKNYRKGTSIAIYHGMVLDEENAHVKGLMGRDILNEFPEYDIILTGDNHKQFVIADDSRVLINPGSLKRDNADQVDHVPFVFTYDSETNKVDKFSVPIENDILDREHIEIKEQRDERLEKLSERFQEAKDITLDFYDNVMSYLESNEVRDETKLRVLEWIS